MSQKPNVQLSTIELPTLEYRAFRTLAYSLYPGCVAKPAAPSPSYEQRRQTIPTETVMDHERDQLADWSTAAIVGLAWSINNVEHELALHAFARLWNDGLDPERRQHYETLLLLARTAAGKVLNALNMVATINNGPLAALPPRQDGKFDA